MVQHVVYQQTHLLYNRHLDQILLSALYGICKVIIGFAFMFSTVHPFSSANGLASCKYPAKTNASAAGKQGNI